VEYTDGDTTKTGYVAKGFLTEYIFEDNEEPTEVPDKNYSESNDVKTVLLVLGVVILVLIAVAYIGFVITRQKNREAK
jgi:hypothetical protein